MTRRSDGPEDVDAAFAEIVADLEREGFGETIDGDLTAKPSEQADSTRRSEPSKAGEPKESSEREETDKAPKREAEPEDPVASSGWRTSEQPFDWEFDNEDEHYEPPEPPPVPRPHSATIVALLLVAIAILLFVAPNLIGIASTTAIPLGAVAAVGAAGLLLFRLRSGPPPGAPGSDDDGAQV